MTVRTARWLLFVVAALAVPLPMLGPFAAFVPPVRYVILFGATAAVAAVEGAAGPVPMIMALFAAHAVGALVLVWLGAWLLARMSAGLSPAARRAVVLVGAAAVLAVAAGLELYRTPFGQAPTATLLGVWG